MGLLPIPAPRLPKGKKEVKVGGRTAIGIPKIPPPPPAPNQSGNGCAWTARKRNGHIPWPPQLLNLLFRKGSCALRWGGGVAVQVPSQSWFWGGGGAAHHTCNVPAIG